MTDLVGYNDIYTMITGKDAVTGKKCSRLVGAAWTDLNFVPVSRVAKLAKAAKVMATAKKAEKLAKRRPARKTAKKAAA
ncbi:hypothetical protein B5726_04985 [Lactiplantibacillus plantarum]|nr:hypothetical protein B5726_04985 [Lactiplantibacillus plantarum]